MVYQTGPSFFKQKDIIDIDDDDDDDDEIYLPVIERWAFLSRWSFSSENHLEMQDYKL